MILVTLFTTSCLSSTPHLAVSHLGVLAHVSHLLVRSSTPITPSFSANFHTPLSTEIRGNLLWEASPDAPSWPGRILSQGHDSDFKRLLDNWRLLMERWSGCHGSKSLLEEKMVCWVLEGRKRERGPQLNVEVEGCCNVQIWLFIRMTNPKIRLSKGRLIAQYQ